MMLKQEKLEEIREASHMKEIKYKRKFERYYNSKVRAKGLLKDDLALRNVQLTGVEQNKGKLSPNWEEPYIIKEVIKDGTFILMESNGEKLPRTWHSDSLRKFYA